jgi:two-component system, chemotaxis family, protein-glutamate methylesterase/glutaminase
MMDEQATSLVVVGGSAGAIEALTTIAADLPADLGAAVCVVIHLPADAESHLADIVSRAGPLPASQAQGGETLCAGRIYVAPPDRHLTVRDTHALVSRGPHENAARPSIDVLFRSAAVSFGRRAVGVVLSGSRDDGVAGAIAVGIRGGCVFVQDPAGALFGTLPGHVVTGDHPNRVLPVAELGPAIAAAVARLSTEPAMSENGHDEMGLETEYAMLDAEAVDRDEPPGVASSYSCPACGGVLWEVGDSDLVRFRCRVGHAYTADGTMDAQGEAVEAALWAALRALRERAQLCERLARRTANAGATRSGKRFGEFAEEARSQAETIRRLLAGANGSAG